MRLHGLTLGFFLPSLALYATDHAVAVPSSPVDLTTRNPSSGLSEREDVGAPFSPLYIRDGGEHGHGHGHGHGNAGVAPVVELNETDVLLGHAPTPPSYWTIDIDRHGEETRHPGLMALHGLMMILAFFGALPAGIALRSVNHAWHGISVMLFWTFVVLGCGASTLYRKLTPNMYEGQMHCTFGYLVLALAFTLSVIDTFAVASRLFSYVRSMEKGDDRVFGISNAEYINLVADEDLDENLKSNVHAEGIHEDETAQWVNDVQRHSDDSPEAPASESTLIERRFSRCSQNSDDTVHEQARFVNNGPVSHRLGKLVFATVERTLVFTGFAQLMHGVVVYTGGCRESYLNGCLAHIIKGGIFWCYGLVSFARFLGSFSEFGWAWNRAPAGHHVSAEFVESFVIFFYGVTNTWMERFGARPGDSYTTKEIQHIGIAVMFWFAGLLGMGLESHRLRRWLASLATASLVNSNRNNDVVAEPASYGGSFNPFPALVIGVTGAAMSAHFQTYLFQVQIHALWGYCLTGFAFLRCLTYLFVWLSPPHSILPSRPPSEALASFFLACGGLIFIMSDEEITFAAMRRGYDDEMMFLNVAVAITCFAFCWTVLVVGFKGWLKSRTHKAVSFHQSA